MSEIVISPNLDKSLNNNSFVELNKSSSNNNNNSTNQTGQTFRLPLKQASKTLFREKSTPKTLNFDGNNTQQQQQQQQQPHHQQSTCVVNLTRLDTNSDCSTSVEDNNSHLPTNALSSASTTTSSSSSIDKSANRTYLMRSSIIYNVLNSNSDILKQFNSKLNPFRNSSNECTNQSNISSSTSCLDSSIDTAKVTTTVSSCATSTANMLHSPSSSPSESPPNTHSSNSSSSFVVNSAADGIRNRHRRSISVIASPAFPVAPVQKTNETVNNDLSSENGQINSFNPNAPGRRDPKCARCQNHNVFTKVKGRLIYL